MYSLNGIGTTLYGKKEINLDGSYIATKWFVLAFLPIIPLGSYRVWEGETETGGFLPVRLKTNYKMIKVKLNWKQIIKTYLMTWGIIISGILFLSLFYA